MHTTSRSVVAAARAHPAGVAAPSAVIVTAIVLLTFVASVIVPSISPSLSGGGSAPVLQPNPSQPRHRVLPQHPVPTGPPILPVLPGALGQGAPGATGKPRPDSSPLPPSTAGSPPGSGPAPGASPHPSPGPAGGCPACYAGHTPAPAVAAVVAGASGALQGTTRILTGSVVPAVTTVVAAASGTAVQAVGGLTSTVTSALPTVLGTSTASAAAKAPVAAAATTVTAAGNAVQGAVRATSTPSQGGSGQDAGTQPAGQTADGQASAGTASVSAKAQALVPDTGAVGAAVKAALPAAGTLPGVG